MQHCTVQMVDQDKTSSTQQNFLPTEVVRTCKHTHRTQVCNQFLIKI